MQKGVHEGQGLQSQGTREEEGVQSGMQEDLPTSL
jgi:hypothetical protein